MTSALMSSQSADDFQQMKRSDVVEEEFQQRATVHQQMLFGQSKLQCPVATQRYPVAMFLSIQSQEIQAQRIVEVARRSSRGDNSTAKQLKTYSKMFVNC
ncbi:hypothetical protein F511_45791 [Dorcoceras hygrometricum]|uniref:Uncharacterized protein n=1 Tax=Dorcoceras hygrometricum TaxID=472368 RepID=A0A2Z6ZV73_9LAMI|nr:hypothetical protein F511_45791 [Dorcoceras hygrometricum]